MAIRSKKVLKALAEKALANDNKKKTPSEYNKDGTPKNWPKVLKKVPMNRNVRIKDLPAQPVFKDEGEKQRFLDQLKAATTGKDWSKEFNDAVKDETVQIEFSGFGNGQVSDLVGGVGETLTHGESQRVAAATNERVQKDNRENPIEGQVMESNFIPPLPATKLEENDIPEYVLMTFMQPGADFKLESTVTVGKEVRIVYQRDPEYFEAIITIGAQRTLNRCIEINSLVIKDGATYAVNGTFCDHPEFFAGAIALKQPRVLKLYNFLCEKLGLHKDGYSVSIPLGATINMGGAAVTITVMAMAAANTLSCTGQR